MARQVRVVRPGPSLKGREKDAQNYSTKIGAFRMPGCR